MRNLKKWMLSIALSAGTLALFGLLTNGRLFLSFENPTQAVLISLLVISLAYRLLMQILKGLPSETKKLYEDNQKGEGVEFNILSGLPNMPSNTQVHLYFEDESLLIKAKHLKLTARLTYDQITEAQIVTREEIQKKQRSPGSRAFWGGVFGGETGAIIGGFSGMQTNEKMVERQYLVILYTSDEKPKNLVFAVTSASIRQNREKALAKLREKAGLQKEVTSKMESSTDVNL